MILLINVLAAEGAPTKENIWNPTILGVLTVICAVGLFCGSVYLLLGTNLGGRLGFLVAAAGLTAFMLLLTTLWWSSGSSGIDPPHGSSPTWNVVEVVNTPADSKIGEVRDIKEKGAALTGNQLTNLKPAIDAGIVPASSINGETSPKRPFATLGFSSSSQYLVDFQGFLSYEEGGGTKNIFWHTPRYAAVQVCTAATNSSGAVITPPKCDPLRPTRYVILKRDLGTLRQPVVLYWFMSLILFALSLLGLHWHELDSRKRARASLAPVPTPGS